MTRILSQFWRLLQLCLAGPGGKLGILLFVIVVALDLGGVYATVRIVEWTGAFYGALEKLNAAEAVWQVGVFFIIVGLNSVRHLTGQFVRKHLEMRWRRSLTNSALDIWLSNRAHWHLANGTELPLGPNGEPVDNPDQRIAEDCRLFLTGLMGEALDLIGRVVGLFSYLVLLWSLADFPLSLAPIGIPLEIPHYMIWAAFIYVALSSLLTHVLGHPLKDLVVEQQRREANFRFALSRFRSNSDEVALAGGEGAERAIFDTRFEGIASNWRKLVSRELILGCFTYPFNHSVLRLPLFVALPGYLAGHVAFGGLMQLGTAFSSVVTSLAWFVFSYRDLAEIVAASSRLDTFLAAAKAAGERGRAIVSQQSNDGTLSLDAVSLATPDGKPMLTLANLSVNRGEVVWLRGASGLGKTTLLKAVAGLWPYRSGTISLPNASMVFLPQRAYFPIGDIRAAMSYPRSPEEFDPSELDRIIDIMGLRHLQGAAFGHAEMVKGHGLSGGEQQRLALTRLLVLRPKWALLDEATSALDVAAEAELFATLRRELPDTSFIIVSHRPPQGLGTLRTIDLASHAQPTTQVELVPA
jgi:vitamin B12/bleomycin/antimicrobial peptide transport system ATP-binding/permease protein